MYGFCSFELYWIEIASIDGPQTYFIFSTFAYTYFDREIFSIFLSKSNCILIYKFDVLGGEKSLQLNGQSTNLAHLRRLNVSIWGIDMIVLFSLDISFDYNLLWSICCICSSTLQESFANGIECFVASVCKQNERNEQIGNEKQKRNLSFWAELRMNWSITNTNYLLKTMLKKNLAKTE